LTRASLALFACLTLAACEHEPEPPKAERAPAPPASGKVEIVKAPAATDVTALIREEAGRAVRDGKKLIVYVGAPWCEPCVRFHDAAAAGKLDQDFPHLRLLEFDRDRDERALGQAGCLSRLIPLFARPTADGRCSERRLEGSIKGEGAVRELTPRLRDLLR
jgi:thiol-disulfide isomerase/thioredoxin